MEVAQARGVPPAQVAMAWLLSKPAVTSPVFGATKDRQMDDADAEPPGPARLVEEPT